MKYRKHILLITLGLTGELAFHTPTYGADDSQVSPASAVAKASTTDVNPVSPKDSSIPQPTTPQVKILVKGITSILGNSLVLFKTVDLTGNEKAYTLGDGQRQDGVQIMHINAAIREVVFNNHGVIQKISLRNAVGDTNVLAEAEGAPQADPHPEIPRPSGMGSGIPAYLGGDANTGQSTDSLLTHDQQILMIEAQRSYYKSLNDPESLRLAGSLPPTSLTPLDTYDSSDETPPPKPYEDK